MKTAGVIFVSAVVTLAGACSVSTPRNEAAAVRAGQAQSAGAGAGDGAGAAADSANPSTAGAASDAGSSAGSGRGSGTGGGRTSAASATGGSSRSGPGASTAAGVVPGVTADSVGISVVAGFSGPLAPIVTKAYEALQTWQDDVNAAGGIYGRKIVLKQVDHKETADGGIAACKEALSNSTFFAVVPEGTDANVTAVNCLDAAGMPTVYYAAATDPAWKIGFADVLTSAQGGTILGSYVHDVLGGADKKIGVMYVNQSAYKAVSDTFVPEAKRLKMTVADVESVEPNQGSFTSQLLHMQQAGVQILVISATTEAIGIIRDARSMGFNVQFTGWGFLFDFVTQAARSLFDGVTGLRAYATVDSPLYPKYAARMAAHGRNRDDRTTDLEGFPTWGRGLLYGEVLKAAGPNPTRQSFVAGAETIKSYDNGVLSPINYGPGAGHVGATAAFPAICCNSDYTWKSQGPARTAF